MAKRKIRLDTETATPEEASAILRKLADLCAEQPTFDLPNPRDRAAWEQEQRRLAW
jgi:hypothetical protein